MVSSSPGGRGHERFRSIFLSDVHLGSPRAQADLLLEFLERHRSDYLFLVGDIADGPEDGSQDWPPAHRAVLERLRRIAREGTRVIYVTGNHDPGFQVLWGTEAALTVTREREHTTADGRRLLVEHGDRFDALLGRRAWLARLGDGLTRLLEHACRPLERLLSSRRGRVALTLRERLKAWLGYTRRFERSAVRAARARALDGIVCGHVHSAASRTIDGLYYGNGGDWVGSATVLVEHECGRMELLAWRRAA